MSTHQDDSQHRATPPEQLVASVAAELDMDVSTVRHALHNAVEEPMTSVLDHTFGPSLLTISTPLGVSPSQAVERALQLLRRHQLSPAAGMWVQDRGQWPDPLAESAVTRVSVWVDRSSVRVVADIATTRRGYWLGAVLGVSLLPLSILAAGPALGLLAGTAGAGAVIGLAIGDYRRRTGAICRNLAEFAASAAQPVMPPSVIG